MKVLAVVDSLALGGAERVLATLAVAAPSAGFELGVTTLTSAEDSRTAMLEVLRNAGVTPSCLGIKRLRDRHALPRLVSEMRRTRCDVVHAHLEYSTILAGVAARLTHTPVVCTLHHVPQNLAGTEAVKERLAVSIGGRGHALVFVSNGAMVGFARRYRARPTWMVVPNGIDLTLFVPGPPAPLSELGLVGDAPVVTLVAALRGHKGHDEALEAWPSVLSASPSATLIFVGEGPDERRLRQVVHDRRLEDSVVFAGLRRDVPHILRASTLVILPSHTEALPTALIEAAACERAVVATDVGGTPDVVVHGRTGLLVPVGDIAALSRAIRELLGAQARRVEMGKAARQLVVERFDADSWAARLRRLYESAVTGRPTVGRGS